MATVGGAAGVGRSLGHGIVRALCDEHARDLEAFEGAGAGGTDCPGAQGAVAALPAAGWAFAGRCRMGGTLPAILGREL